MITIKKSKKSGKITPNGSKYQGNMSKWKDEFYVRIHELAKNGLRNSEIASSLGVSLETLKIWIKKRPALKQALLEARRSEGEISETPFRDYVYKRLDPKLQELWEEINELDEHDNGVAMMDAIFKNSGKRARQHLFIHALICSNFNATRACQKVGISVKTLRTWSELDPGFADLIQEIHFHKSNFFEEALVKLVKSGDPSAVIFVNKTFNKDRGYSEKVAVEVTDKSKGMVDISDLDLPIETRRELLKALRDKTQEKKPVAALEHKPDPKNLNIEVKAKVVGEEEE